MVRILSVIAFLVSGMATSVATASDAEYPALDFYSLYQRVESAPFPIEYVYTEGANKPAFEKFAVPKFYVADLNNDRCDDVLLDWADSAGEPIVFFGNKSGKLEARDVFPGHNKVRTIREAGFEDLNGDGFLDIVGFSISHDKPELNWDFYEPEFIALSDGDGQFSVMKNKIKTESHAGLLADLNHDGNVDILPLNTIKASQSIKVVDSTKIGKGSIKAPKLSGYSVFDADAGDLNGDGLIDVVLSVMPNHRKNKYVTPERLNKNGSLFIYFGDKSTPLSKVEPVKIGTHWASNADWEGYLKTRGQTSTFNRTGIAAPSNADLIDIDGDGDLDIVAGYFVEHKSSWSASGFQIYENKNGVFSLATSQFAPTQPSNRNLEDPTSFIMDFFFEDIDGDGNKDLLLSHMGNANQNDAALSASIFLNRDGVYTPVSLQTSNRLPNVARSERLLTPGDFNCDGKKDLITIGGAPKLHHDMFRVYLARSVPLTPPAQDGSSSGGVQSTGKEVAACRFEITKEYADDPETYVMNKGELRITDSGRILFGKNRGYNQKGKSERQFKTLLQDYAQLTFSSTDLTGDFQTVQGSKESRPVIVSMMAPRTPGSFEGAYAFNYEGRGTGEIIIKNCVNIAAQNIATRSKGDLRERVACYMADAVSAGAKDLPTPDELTKLIKAVVDSSAAKVSKLALRRFGLRKETITAHGASLLELLNFNGTNAEFCEQKMKVS